MNAEKFKPMVEAILMASETPVPIERLIKLLDDENSKLPSKDELREIVESLQQDYSGHGVELVEVASGYRFQARADYADRIARLWDERRPRYSRALLETLAIIAYRQPITRGEIEHIRGVAVSTNIVRILLEREWVRVVGHRDVPGRPALFATTKQFLDYFGMRSLDELPSLAELKDIDDINADLFSDLAPGPLEPAPSEAEEALDGAMRDAEIGSITARQTVDDIDQPGADTIAEEIDEEEIEPSAAAR